MTSHQQIALDRVWLELSGDQETKQNKSVSSRILTFHQQHQIGSGWNCPEIWTQNQTSWSFPQILTCHQQKALDRVWLELSGDLETKQVRQFTDFNIPSTALDWVWLELSGDLEIKQVSSQILTSHQQTALDRVWPELSEDLEIKLSQFMDWILTFHQKHWIGFGWTCQEIRRQSKTSQSFHRF